MSVEREVPEQEGGEGRLLAQARAKLEAGQAAGDVIDWLRRLHLAPGDGGDQGREGTAHKFLDAKGQRLVVGAQVKAPGMYAAEVEGFEWFDGQGWCVAVAGGDREGAVSDSFPTVAASEEDTFGAEALSVTTPEPPEHIEGERDHG